MSPSFRIEDYAEQAAKACSSTLKIEEISFSRKVARLRCIKSQKIRGVADKRLAL
jgi:hypothetical protein